MTNAPGSATALSIAEREAMGRAEPQRAALIGCGQIGGSLLLALRARGLCGHTTGYDLDGARLESAWRMGIVDAHAASAQEVVLDAELVVLAVPPRALPEVAREVALALPRAALVLDVGSTKARVVTELARALPHPERHVGCHPIAGTERSGPEAASSTLFLGRPVVLTPTPHTLPEALAATRALWTLAGAHPTAMDADLHDRVLALTSHLPHAAAYALAAAVGRALDEDAALAEPAARLAGQSYADTTRVAASDPVMWRDIFLENRDALLPALDALLDELAALRAHVASADADTLEAFFRRARTLRLGKP